MISKTIRYLGHLAFVVYLGLSVLIPAPHSHAVESLSGNNSHKTCHAPLQLPCCELHESGHAESDEGHIHYLLDGQGITAARCHSNNLAGYHQVVIEVVDDTPYCLLKKSVDAISFGPDFYQEAVLSYTSGLSPPSS